MSKAGWLLVGIVVGCVVGVVATRLWPGLSPAGVARQTIRAQPPNAMNAVAAVSDHPHPAKASAPRVVIPPRTVVPAGESAKQAVARLQMDNDRLRAELIRVQSALDTQKAVRRAEDGEPVPPPPDLDPRFSQSALLDATQQALKAAGFDKAQVTNIDCTEYPCIVYGEGMGDEQDFKRLESTDALAAYKDDSKWAMGWGTSVDGGHIERFGFAVGAHESDPSRKSALQQRIDYRSHQMMGFGN